MDAKQILQHMHFGRVDAETDTRYASCFVGTEMLRHVLLPQHTLLIGDKGSGKSAIFRLLNEDLQKVAPLLPSGYRKIYCIPAYGLQSEENLDGGELFELNPTSISDYRYFWLLYLGLKTAATLAEDTYLQQIIQQSKNEKLKTTYAMIGRMLHDVGFLHADAHPNKLRQRIESWIDKASQSTVFQTLGFGKLVSVGFRQKAGFNIITLLDYVDLILQETRSLAWVMLDKLDLLYIGEQEKLKVSITGLVQLLVEYSNRWKSVHFKIFLRTDIYRQLQIVNKSHLVSYTFVMKWREPLLLKLLVSRAVLDAQVRQYCESALGLKVDVSSVITGTDEYVRRVFYTLFDENMRRRTHAGHRVADTPNTPNAPDTPDTIEWIMKRLPDGLGNRYPREIIHLGNSAVERQIELHRKEAIHPPARVIGSRAVREAFERVSAYRCDTYLYSEYPHLSGHIDVFRGCEGGIFTRERLHEMFKGLTPDGNDAILEMYEIGLLQPGGKSVYSSQKFKIPPLYKSGLGIIAKKKKAVQKESRSLEKTEADRYTVAMAEEAIGGGDRLEEEIRRTETWSKPE